jgi:hypothetical protein
MEYKQGLDRVGDSTSFPFPIKLEYDSSNIYLTPLWIPETSSVLVVKDKITKQPINLLDANELGNLWLCLEVADGKNKFYRASRSQWKLDKNGWVITKLDHPSRGGKYRLFYQNPQYLNEGYPYNNLNIGRKYTIKYINSNTGRNIFSNYGGERVARFQELSKWFVYVRGTYRYGYYTDLKRTGIYSNVVKLEFNLDQ